MAGLEKDSRGFLKGLVDFIRRSSESYDSGYTGEAHRQAAAIKAVFQGGDGGPLLERCGLTGLYFYDNSTDYNPAIGLPFSGLAVLSYNVLSPEFKPRLGKNPRIKSERTPFPGWWDKTVIVYPDKGITLTRKGVINAVSSADTGGPRDGALDSIYNGLILQTDTGWVGGGAGLELTTIELASVRQISYELLKSLEEQAPWLF